MQCEHFFETLRLRCVLGISAVEMCPTIYRRDGQVREDAQRRITPMYLFFRFDQK